MVSIPIQLERLTAKITSICGNTFVNGPSGHQLISTFTAKARLYSTLNLLQASSLLRDSVLLVLIRCASGVWSACTGRNHSQSGKLSQTRQWHKLQLNHQLQWCMLRPTRFSSKTTRACRLVSQERLRMERRSFRLWRNREDPTPSSRSERSHQVLTTASTALYLQQTPCKHSTCSEVPTKTNNTLWPAKNQLPSPRYGSSNP